ncbi:MAG: toll/interleukin-1 receptor domain-containing protein [Parasporobacterium sp.]|nr:toll/interleukin-1 receptor domain-containing protein [Parasporobacterium sp.]
MSSQQMPNRPGNASRSFDVYISSTNSDRNVAVSLAYYLAEQGMTCRVSQGGVPGQTVQNAKVMVLVFTDSVFDSAEIMQDVASAVEHGVTIIPFRLTEKMPSGNLGFYLGPLHWLDAFTQTEMQAKENLAGLCRSAIEPQKAVPDGEGPEMALLRKKRKKRNLILLFSAIAFVIVLAVVLVFLLRDTTVPARELSCQAFMEKYEQNLKKLNGKGDYRIEKAEGDEIKYGIFQKEEDGNYYLAVVIRFFGYNNSDPESEQAKFEKIGITNLEDNQILMTEEDWTPYLKSAIRIFYPKYSNQQIEELLGQIYDLKDGGSRVVKGEYAFDYSNVDSVFLLETEIK